MILYCWFSGGRDSALACYIATYVAKTRGWRPHDLRHAFILKALIETKSLELVRRWVAHSKYDLLRQYADVVGLEFDKPIVEL